MPHVLQMAVSLGLTGWWMYIDVAETPRAVVICVIIFNAAFGYSWGPIPWLYPPEVCLFFVLCAISWLMASLLDHAFEHPCEGRVPVYRNKLAVQLHCGRNDPRVAGADRVATLPHARLLLRLQLHPW